MNENLNGCGGRLCRLLRWSAVKFEGRRFAEENFGETDMDNAILEYRLCGKVGVKFGSGNSSADIPGSLGRRNTSLTLTVISSSEDISEGDIISDGNEEFRILSRISQQPKCYALERFKGGF